METVGGGDGGGGGGGGRRLGQPQAYTEEKEDSHNLRDFLRLKQEEAMNNRSGFTLGSALSDKRTMSNRTLLDIIRDDPSGGVKDNKKSWRHFKDKLKLRRNGSGSSWTSTVPVPTSDIPINGGSYHNNSNGSYNMSQSASLNNRMITRRHSTRYGGSSVGESDDQMEGQSDMNTSRPGMLQRNVSRALDRPSGRFDGNVIVDEDPEEGLGETAEAEEVAETGEEEQPVRMSLMALLAETDRQMGLDGSAYMMDEEEDDEDEEEDVVKGGNGEYNNCCVCMVRHKGAAFIPCGHTFCRLCSRELYVQRGSCPLCNNFILEILDIF